MPGGAEGTVPASVRSEPEGMRFHASMIVRSACARESPAALSSPRAGSTQISRRLGVPIS